MFRSFRFTYEKGLVVLCLLLSAVSFYSMAVSNYLLTYIVFIVSFAALTAGYFLLNRAQLFRLLFLFVPLSVGVSLPGEAEIQLPTEPMIGMLSLLLVLYLPRMWNDVKPILRHPITLILFAELIWMTACTINSALPPVSLKYMLIRSCYVGTFFLLATFFFQKDKNPWILYLLYAVGMIIPIIKAMTFHAALGFLQRNAYVMSKPFYNDHTVYGACIAFVLPVLILLGYNMRLFSRSRLLPVFLMALLGFLIIAEYLSFSRAAWLSLAGATALYITLRMGMTGKTFLVLVGLVAIGIMLNFDTLYGKLAENKAVSNRETLDQHIKSITSIEADVSNKERINRWKCALRMGDERPIFGFGPRTYKFYYGRYQLRQDMTYTSTFTGNRGHAHSEYLQYYAETGIPGFVLHVLLYIFVVYKGIECYRLTTDRRNKIIALMALLGFSTYVIHGVFNGFMDEDKMASLVFVSFAVIVYLDVERHKPQQEETPPELPAA